MKIAMWSGPRNVSTAMMRAFGNRSDCAVVDEPFYAAYLAATGLEHPMRAEILASQPTDWRDVVAALDTMGPASLIYEKHMAHHMLPRFGRHWLRSRRNAFLIRPPEDVLRSYAARREAVTIDDIGFRQQAELFDIVAEFTGSPPPVIAAAQILAAPGTSLRALCVAIGIAFDPAMLRWPAGPRPTDGVWAPAWYAAVERSTGFTPPREAVGFLLPAELQRIADAARPHFEHVSRFALRPEA